MKKISLLILLSFVSNVVLANNLGEDKAWQWKSASDQTVRFNKHMLREQNGLGRLGDARLSAGSGGYSLGGSAIGNNITVNYMVTGDGNTISNNTLNSDQLNNGNQQSNINENSTINNSEESNRSGINLNP